MERRQLIGAGALALGAAAVGYATFAPTSDEELIAAVLDALAAALSFDEHQGNPVMWGARLSGEFKELMTPQVQIQVAEVHGKIPSSREKLGMAAALVLQRYGSLALSFSALRTSVAGDGAQVEATAHVAGQLYGEFRQDTRQVQIGLDKSDGDWRVSTALVRTAEAVA